MGLIRDAIGAALGADQVKNGLNGPKGRLLNSASRYASSLTQTPPSRTQNISYASYSDQRSQYSSNNAQYDFPQDRAPVLPPRDEFPPRYELSADNDSRDLYETPVYNPQPYNPQPYDPQSYYEQTPQRGVGYPGDINFAFRPIALPQISYGDGQPFLRGYANELRQYGISERDFISLIDAINVTIIPNPENQIFQKGANIAGWFLPGAASIGLTLGQIGVGVGSAIGNNSAIARQLSKANLELFLPNGLELCIGKTRDLEAEIGLPPNFSQAQSLYGLRPEERCARYGDMITPLSRALPPLEQRGRSDPIAMLGQGIASRGNQKKIQKAEKEMTGKKRKTKSADALEGGLQWLIVRKASANALAYWRQTTNQTH